MNELNLSVKGMMCGSCEKRVTNALGQLNGVKTCVANASNGTVKTTYDDTMISKEIIKETIDEIGYIVDAEI